MKAALLQIIQQPLYCSARCQRLAVGTAPAHQHRADRLTSRSMLRA